ncbi:MAG: class I SAM-dependent methyltransferase [Pseudomonadota bacterium]
MSDSEPTDRSKQKTGQGGYFQSGGARYAQFRPTYPAALAKSLAALPHSQKTALDAGCGTGQLTALLANAFEQVVGIDPSASQLAHAVQRRNIRYREQEAENSGLPEASVDLVVAAQAAHWLDLNRFYAEVRRIGTPGAVIALVSYGVPYLTAPVNAIFQKGYWQDLHAFWPQERRHVEEGYADLPFPFVEIADLPAHSCRKTLSVDRFISYISTWSAYRVAQDSGDKEAFDAFFAQLRRAWPSGRKVSAVWPISVRAGSIH